MRALAIVLLAGTLAIILSGCILTSKSPSLKLSKSGKCTDRYAGAIVGPSGKCAIVRGKVLF